jgi:hypothetical protein
MKSLITILLEAALVVFNNLTFRVFASILTLGVLVAIAAFLLDNRSWLFNSAISENTRMQSHIWAVSQESQKALFKFMSSSDDIQYVGVTSVDLKKNRRKPELFLLKDPARQQLVTIRSQNILLSQPMFDYNHNSTKIMVRVIANEFVCISYEEAYYSQFFPEFKEDMPIVCHIAIPPYTGQFFGYISISLKRQLSYNELEAIRIEMARLAVDVFLRDIIKKPIGHTDQ